MVGRAPKTCSWRDPERPSRGCSRPAVPAANGDDFRCGEHQRNNFAGKDARRVRPLTEDEKDFIRRRDFHVCRECGADAHEVDHIVEAADGGTNDPGNLQLLCDLHHRTKTRRSQEQWKPTDRKTSRRAALKRQYRRQGFYQQ